jgi:hypothetical protein
LKSPFIRVKKSRIYPGLKTWIPDLYLYSKKKSARIQVLEYRNYTGTGIIRKFEKTCIPDPDPGKIRPGSGYRSDL